MKFETKRIIAGIDVKDGRIVKGVNFADFKDAGDPVEGAVMYAEAGADEICLLDIAATVEKRGTFVDLIKKVREKVGSTPISVSGGIRESGDIGAVLEAVADFVGIGTAAVKNPALVKEAVKKYGGEKIKIALDAKKQPAGNYTVLIEMGMMDTGIDALKYAKECEASGAGSILLTSFETDGAKQGYNIPLLKLFSSELKIPVIASGGAGSMEHFLEVFRKTEVESAFAASVFHFGTVKIPELKAYLKQNGIKINL
ncbi:MAG: imidazole glycerol phosphate synthase cyclase subunit [Oscillospiraceae bacterium]|nr:imidazole glycerol phosphate synthase cyclase subunit [Oscillospiraceae bacterium]